MTLARARLNCQADMIAVVIAQLTELEATLRAADCELDGDEHETTEAKVTFDGPNSVTVTFE